MPLRPSHSRTQFAFLALILPVCAVSACAKGSSTLSGGAGGSGGEGGEAWGAQSSSSSATSSGSGGSGGGGSSSSSASSSSSSSGGSSAPAALVVLRVGDGFSALTNAATPVFIEHLRTDGTPVAGKVTISLPTTQSGSNAPLTLSGTANAEGNLSLSSNGKYVVVAGYAAAVGTLNVTATDATFYPRVVGRIDGQGNVNTTTTLGTAYSGTSVRGATSSDGVSFWVSGNGSATLGGVHYATLGTASGTQILSAPANARFIHVFANQLYGTSGAGTYVNVFSIGSGLPKDFGQTATSLPGMPTVTGPSPYSFALLDRLPGVSGVDTLYVADDRSVANGGGIQRWVFDGFSWTLETTFTDGTSGVRGLAAMPEGNGVRIVATTSESPTNRILSLFDDGGFSPTIVPIAISPTNTAYRGIAFAPQ